MNLRLLHYADLEAAYDNPTRIGKVAGLINELRDEETIVCGAGDNIGPGVLSLVTQGRQALDFFHGIEAAVDTFGNHDFDHGVQSLRAVVQDSPQTWVCANAYLDNERFGVAEGVASWTVIETESHSAGFIGVAHPETAEINPNAAPVQFTDPIIAVEDCVDTLQKKNVDTIVVLSHLGDNTALAQNTEVDLILGGHHHEREINRVSETVICRPGGVGRYLLEVSFDDNKPRATHHPVDEGSPDGTVVDAIEKRMEASGLTNVIGNATDEIICDLMACKRGESKIGNLITDAYRWKTDADVALNSGGGFRRRPPLRGAVTAFDLISVLPYDSDLLVLRLDGKTLLQAFRQLALEDAPEELPQWQFGHVSGASLVWDDETSELLTACVSNTPVEPTATYDVVASEFTVENDSLFPAFGLDDVVRRDGLQYKAVVDYVRETGLDPEIERRISRPNLNQDTIPERDWPNSP